MRLFYNRFSPASPSASSPAALNTLFTLSSDLFSDYFLFLNHSPFQDSWLPLPCFIWVKCSTAGEDHYNLMRSDLKECSSIGGPRKTLCWQNRNSKWLHFIHNTRAIHVQTRGFKDVVPFPHLVRIE